LTSLDTITCDMQLERCGKVKDLGVTVA